MEQEHRIDVQWDTARAKGTDLERRVSEYFVQRGYSCSTNVILEGRSGGKHEIDVFATKRDGIIEYRLMIECKFYTSPVSKDVVSKVKLVRDDLNIDKAMIVCPSGFMSGAEIQANDLGIDLWTGPERLSPATGEGAIRKVVVGQGWPHAAGKFADNRSSSGRGFFRKEDVLAMVSGYVECHLIRVHHVKARFGKSTSATTLLLTDGIEGRAILIDPAGNTLQEVRTAVAILSSRAGSTTSRDLSQLFESAASVTSLAKKTEFATELKVQGLDPRWNSMRAEAVGNVLLPVVLSLRRSREGERVIASLDMPLSPRILIKSSDLLSEILTRNLHRVRPVLLPEEPTQSTSGGSNDWTEVDDLLSRGKKIGAIKAYRRRTNAGLRESKEAVEARAQVTRRPQ